MYRNVRTYAATCRTKHENVERTVTSGSYVRARGAVSLQQSTVYRSVMYTACAFVSYSSPSVSFSKPILIHEFQLRAQWIAAPPLTHVADTQCREYRFRLPSYVQSRRYSFSPDFEREREGGKTICASFIFQRILPRSSFEKDRIVDGGKMEEGEGAASDGFPPPFVSLFPAILPKRQGRGKE